MGFRSWYLWSGMLPFTSLLSRLLWPRATAGVLATYEGRLLAIDTGDYLMLPLGALESGETFAEAARREASEETGVDVELGDCVDERINVYGGVERLFSASPTREAPLADPSWEGEPTWIPLEEVTDRRWRFDRPVGRYVDALVDGADEDVGHGPTTDG